jgi:ActR/RegA family two-component response regulator
MSLLIVLYENTLRREEMINRNISEGVRRLGLQRPDICEDEKG